MKEELPDNKMQSTEERAEKSYGLLTQFLGLKGTESLRTRHGVFKKKKKKAPCTRLQLSVIHLPRQPGHPLVIRHVKTMCFLLLLLFFFLIEISTQHLDLTLFYLLIASSENHILEKENTLPQLKLSNPFSILPSSNIYQKN